MLRDGFFLSAYSVVSDKPAMLPAHQIKKGVFGPACAAKRVGNAAVFKVDGALFFSSSRVADDGKRHSGPAETVKLDNIHQAKHLYFAPEAFLLLSLL